MQAVNPFIEKDAHADLPRATRGDAEIFLSELMSRDVRIWPEGGKLRYRAPKGVLTPHDIEALRVHKEELVRFLEQVERATRKIPPLTRRPRPDAIPASFAQERLWFLEQMGLLRSAYHIPLALTLHGSLDVDALDRSLEELIRRHESLRTRFELRNRVPYQVIDAPQRWVLEMEDFSTLPRGERDMKVQELLREEMANPFDLARGPLVRVRLLRLDRSSHVLLATLHHIVSDDWSMSVMAMELSALYGAFSQGLPSPLAELPVQYADYALWQREWMQGEVLERRLEYWRRKLADAAPVLALPADKPRPAVASFKGRSYGFTLTESLSNTLAELGRADDATPFMVLLAGFQLFLSKYSGQQDVVVGTSVTGRPSQEIEGLIGFFVNTLVLRANVSGELSFRQLLKQVRETTLGAQAHQDVPFEKLVMELSPQQDLSRQPLFQVMFAFQNAPQERLDLPQVQLGMTGAAAGCISKFDLTLHMQQAPVGLAGAFEYATDLFESGTIERWTAQFKTLLENIVADPDRRCSQISSLDSAERQWLEECNATQEEYPQERCIHDLFAEQATRTPDAPALISDAGRMSYRELDERSNRLAHYLISLGASPEDSIGVCAERSLELTVGLLGVLKAGCAYLPIDPTHPAQRIALVLEEARARVLLVQERWLEQLPAQGIPRVLMRTDWPLIAQCPPTMPIVRARPQSLAYVIYTSGSTGKPKAVAAMHAAVVNRILAQRLIAPLEAGDVCCQKTAIGFVDSVVETLGPLLHGLPLVVVSDQVGRATGELIARIEHYGVTYLVTVPSLAQALIQNSHAQQGLRSVRQWVLSGENLPISFLQELRQRLPQCRFVNIYGCSEVGADATCHSCDDDGVSAASIGRPIANLKAYVLNEELELSPIGVPGELYIGGVGLARGYLNDVPASAERFVASPFGEPGQRLFRTGDLARRRPDGNLEFIGRLDHQVKVLGSRIEPAEVEAALLQHSEVHQAAVIARQSGTDSLCTQLTAYVVAEEGCAPTSETLHHHLRQMLPEYMVPHIFERLDRLPLNASGKIDRQALGRLEMQPSRGREYLAPRTRTEETLVRIWMQVLRVEQVGVRDNFFDLGGHSLLATRVTSQVRELFGIELKLKELFQHPRIELLAARIDERLQAEDRDLSLPVLLPRRQAECMALSYAQERWWCLEQAGEGGPACHVILTLDLPGDVDIDWLERSGRALLERHEILRTRFEVRNAAVVQIVEPAPAMWQVHRQETNTPFDLGVAPLFKVELGTSQAGVTRLTLVAHPIVCDGYSLELLAEEIAMLYAALVRQRPPPLPHPLVHYADYAVWERSWLKDEQFDAQARYWHEISASTQELRLPPDHLRPQTIHMRYAMLELELPSELSGSLLRAARHAHVTPYVLILTAFQLLLAHCSGQQKFWIALPMIGRAQWQIRQLPGPFEKTLALPVDVSRYSGFGEWLKFTQQEMETAAERQRLSLEDIAAQLPSARDLPRLRAAFAWTRIRENAPIVRHASTAFDLSLCVRETATQVLTGHFEYACDVFELATVDRWRSDFIQLLHELVHDERPDVNSDAPMGIESHALSS